MKISKKQVDAITAKLREHFSPEQAMIGNAGDHIVVYHMVRRLKRAPVEIDGVQIRHVFSGPMRMAALKGGG